MFAAELTGHFFYRFLGFIEAPIFSLLKVLEIVKNNQRPISEIVRPFARYFQSEEINFEVADQEKVLRLVEEHYSDADKIIKLDGVSIFYPDWWFNLRKSNTEPLIRLNIEADTAELLEQKKNELADLIK